MADVTPSTVADALRKVTAQLPGGGEDRPGQIEMAEAVAVAMLERRHLVVQAGTGTGKSLAYLVPAVLLGEKVVVATATKALQDQLAGKDLPFLAAHLGVPVDFSVLKGRSNYLCRQRAAETQGGANDQLELDDIEQAELGEYAAEVLRVLDWGRTTDTGDRADLAFEPRPRVWAGLSVTAMECPGALRCPSGAVCLAERSRRRAEEAAVVVVNTHLYGAHLASGGHVLPDHDVVVFDEAHELEDIAAASLGLEIGAGRLRALARVAQGIVKDRALVDDVHAAADLLEAALAPALGRRLPNELNDTIGSAVAVAAERVNRLTSAVRAGADGEARKARALQAAGHLAGDLAFARAVPDTDVVWVDGVAHAPSLRVAAIDVGQRLSDQLWGEVTAVLTSATIPPALGDRLGLPPQWSKTRDVGSPFAFDRQALLYCAAHLPDPRRAEYEPAMHDELEHLIRAAGGRTLALFTSWRVMRAAAEVLRSRLPYDVMTQSDLPKPALVERFAAAETSCLFATMGFWQGVDVPGPSLSLVTIDRIPFPRPDEPLFQARRDRAGGGAFRVVDLPRAATLLAQGAGRLIRCSTDFGVVAVLDPRLATASYRWELVRALPPMARTRHLSDVDAFFAARPGATPAASAVP
jgi:ATP-dependent DNA helicase DinG